MPAESVHIPPSTDFGETLATPSRPEILLGGQAGGHLEVPTASQFGKYAVIGELGEGGMGRVYKAVDTELGRIVAIKALRSTDPFEASRFRGEAEMIAALDHPNVIKVYDIATPPEGRPYIVLEFCEGGSLDKELGGHPVEPRRAAEMVETLARAVQFAHEKGVIHRDLKPANVLRGKDKTLKLTDFGLAKELEVSSGMTPSNAVMGTPSYMSPEQAEGKTKLLGPPTDVYGLGAILYELLTGRPPFRGVNMVDTLEQVRWAEPAPPSRLVPRLHRDLATICIKCLQKTPTRRYATAAELADDLRRWLNGETITARRAPSWERFVRQVKRRPWEAAAITALLMLVGGAVAAGLYVRERDAQDELRRAQEDARATDDRARDALRQAHEGAERERRAEQARQQERLRVQAERSLAALNEIRALVLDGPLRHHAGLDPLYDKLSAYYDRLIAEDDLGFDKVELADGLVKVGDLFARTGQKGKARDAYRTAAERCRARLADPRARGVLAAALLKGGQAAFDQEDYPAAEAAAAEVAALLAGLAPPPTGPITDPLAASQIAEAFHLRGQVEGQRNEFAKSEESYKRAIAPRERLAVPFLADLPPSGPERKRALAALADLGRGYGYLGDALLDGNKPSEAEAAYWRSQEIRKRVAEAFPTGDKSGEALDAKRQFAHSWGNFIGLHARARALGTARFFAHQALAAHLELTTLDPINPEYRLDVCNRRLQLAELDIQMLARPGADAARRAEAAAHLSDVLKAIGDPATAKEKLTRRAQGMYATALVLTGMLVFETDAVTARETYFVKGHFLFEALCKDAPGVTVDPAHLFYWAVARAMMYEANPTTQTPDRAKERIAAVRAAVEKGGAKRRHPDDIEQFRAFRSLAGHPDFQKLMTDLRAATGAKAAPAPKS